MIDPKDLSRVVHMPLTVNELLWFSNLLHDEREATKKLLLRQRLESTAVGTARIDQINALRKRPGQAGGFEVRE